MSINILDSIYLKMEYSYRHNSEEKLIISGYLESRYWVRFTYYKRLKTLVCINTITSEKLIYNNFTI